MIYPLAVLRIVNNGIIMLYVWGWVYHVQKTTKGVQSSALSDLEIASSDLFVTFTFYQTLQLTKVGVMKYDTKPKQGTIYIYIFKGNPLKKKKHNNNICINVWYPPKKKQVTNWNDTNDSRPVDFKHQVDTVQKHGAMGWEYMVKQPFRDPRSF